MFGFSLTEVVVVLIVGIIVIGPRQLPTMLRTVGKWTAKARKFVFDMREQSGIDEILRYEGLERDIRELQELVRGNVFDGLRKPVSPAPVTTAGGDGATPPPAAPATQAQGIDLGSEYPVVGCDSYGAVADDVAPYVPEPIGTEPAPGPELPPGGSEPRAPAREQQAATVAQGGHSAVPSSATPGEPQR